MTQDERNELMYRIQEDLDCWEQSDLSEFAGELLGLLTEEQLREVCKQQGWEHRLPS